MKTNTVSFFVLFALVAGMTMPTAFADHSEVTIEPVEGSGVLGCEETDEGCYIPMTATVDVGGVVIMSNTDNAAHTFTSGTVSDADGVFDTSLLQVGASFEWIPTEAGEQPYFCQVHPWMIGTIIVQEAGAESGENMMDEASGTDQMSDGTMVSIHAAAPTAGESLEISVDFKDSEHVNYDIAVTQNGDQVLDDSGAHMHDGKGTHTTEPLGSDDPVSVTVTFQGYGVDDPKTGPIGEQVTFTNVVPEFGTIAMMVLAVAIISIIAVTAKSRVVPRL